jgi:hypothetical protein
MWPGITTRRGILNMDVEVKHWKEIRRNGYIATLRQARKRHKCSGCGFLIEPGQEYYKVVAGGGGLGWIKFPDRCHPACLEDYLRRR